MIVIVSVLFVIVCITIHYLILTFRERLKLIEAAKVIPGPKTVPIIGNANYFLKWPTEEFLQNLMEFSKVYTSPFRFWLGSHLLIYVFNADQVKVLLQNSYAMEKSIIYRCLKPWLRKGLITADASTWYTHRKIVSSCFNTNMLRMFFETFAEQSLEFIDQLSTIDKEKEIDLLDYITKINLDILYATTLGLKLESEKNQNYQYVHALNKLKEIFLRRTMNIFLSSDFVFNLTSLKREHQKHLDFVHSVGIKIIERKKKEINMPTFTENENRKTKRKVLLDILMKVSSENKKYTQDNILDEISTFFLAGSDTTSTTLYFTIYMLANFPEIQEKLYEELSSIYGTTDARNELIKFDDLQYMKYMDCVIQETMRVFPVVPFFGRHLIEDLQLGNCIAPKNSNVMVMTMHLHRNEEYWPNALKFDPDRFLPENSVNRHPYCYIPFSEGPRNCIGKKYAMLSMKVFLATLLRMYELKIDKRRKIEDIKVKSDMLLKAAEPLKVKLVRRNLSS